MRVERRKSKRCCIKGSVLAVFKPEPARVVPVIDIGFGGLGISVNETGYGKHGLNRCSFLELMLTDCSFYLDILPYELFSESRNFNLNTVTFLQNQFYGLKLLDLMPSQKVHLKHFIRKYTTGGITPQFIQKFNQFFHKVLSKRQNGNAFQNNWLQLLTL